MENNEKNNKKAIITLVVGIGVLLVLIFSATFAYFSVTSRNNFGTKTITGTAEATGSVALNGTSTSLRLNLTGTDMMKGEDDITYWATSDGTPSTTQNVVTIGSTQVTGAGYYNCDYTLSVTGTGTNNMYTAFQGMSGKSTEQIVLKIGDTKYDFNTANLFPITINGTLTGVTGSSVKSLTAEFYIVNKETVVQDALAGKDLNITITATNFSCTAVEDPNDYWNKNWVDGSPGSNSTSIVFMNTVNVPEDNSGCGNMADVSEKQNGSIMMSFDSNNCEYDDVTYYIGQNGGVLAPPDSSYLFSGMYFDNINLTNFDTSHVTNMSYMFTGYGNWDHPTLLNLSGLNTSNVTNMRGMFQEASVAGFNFTNWNTSHVTDMSSMFQDLRYPDSTGNVQIDLSPFDTSSVTDMSMMFFSCGYDERPLKFVNLSSFDTSHVADMSMMFNCYQGTLLDLSSFNTSSVTEMGYMFSEAINLTTIYASNNFVTTNLTNAPQEMFLSCSNLVGGNGTTYYVNDSTFARIDAPGTPGYFTLKSN